MANNVILSGYFGFKNFGDEAILSLLVNKLKEYNFNISIITSDPNYTKSLYSDIFCVKTFDFFRIIRQIIKSDTLISGGGSLLQDVTSLKSLIYYILVIFTALFFRKKVIIFAQGIGPVNTIIGKFLVKNIIKHCTFITVRDEKSYELLKSWGINSKIVCDPVFSAKIPNKEKKHQLGIQLRSFKNISNDFLKTLADEIIEQFPDYSIKLISLQDSLDIEICDNFKNIINTIKPNSDIKLYSNMTLSDVIEEISECEYIIGMRFHSLIISLLSGTKTLGINYDIKVENLAKEFDLPLIELSDPNVKNAIKKLKNQNLEYQKEIISNKIFDWNLILKVLNS